MCLSIKLSDREIETLGELRQIAEPVLTADAPYMHHPDDDNCLCWVDIPATLKGWTLDFPDHGMFVTATAPAPSGDQHQEPPRAAERT